MFRKYGPLALFVTIAQSSVVYPNDSLEDTFRQCLISLSPGGFGHCLGVGAINKLQSLDSSPEFDLVDGVTLIKNAQEYRDGYNFADRDPSSLRGLVESFNHVFSRRNLEWNMGFVYPGLMLRVAPSVSPGGQLEFVLDSQREALNVQSLKEAGTGRLLARQFLVPLLLGFKFNMASLVPILFGLLALLAKKALVISKLALLATSAFGLGSLLFGQGNQFQQYQHHGGGGQYYHGYSGYHGNRFVPYKNCRKHIWAAQNHGQHQYRDRYPEEEYLQNHFYRDTQENVQPTDQVVLYEDLAKSSRVPEDQNDGRNFAWSEDEKKTQEKPA